MLKEIKRFWKYIWEADTLTAYVLNILVAFLIIKFLIYPGLGLLFGTSFPVVAVVSSSMEHDGSFEEWWASPALCDMHRCQQGEWYTQRGMTKENWDKYFFKNGFNKGDVMVLFGTPPQNIRKGDVIVFQAGGREPIIHRVVDVKVINDKYVFETKGDHNPDQLSLEKYILEDQIIGKAVFRIPFFGYIKIWFVDLVSILQF